LVWASTLLILDFGQQLPQDNQQISPLGCICRRSESFQRGIEILQYLAEGLARHAFDPSGNRFLFQAIVAEAVFLCKRLDMPNPRAVTGHN